MRRWERIPGRLNARHEVFNAALDLLRRQAIGIEKAIRTVEAWRRRSG
jgi:hypothetical protein